MSTSRQTSRPPRKLKLTGILSPDNKGMGDTLDESSLSDENSIDAKSNLMSDVEEIEPNVNNRADITTNDISRNITTWKGNRNRNEHMNVIRATIKSMRNEESEYISNGICSLDVTLDTKNVLESLDTKELKKTIDTLFYNADVMNAMSCIMESTFITSNYKKFDSQARQIRRWYDAVNTIGSRSISGVAMSTTMKDTPGIIVLKAPQNYKDNDSFVHELFVGLYGTNILRQYIPNFSYVFGGFTCNPPKVDDNHVTSWCIQTNGNIHTQYIAYEAIFPSTSFNRYAKNATPEEYVLSYLQIVLALNLAEKQISFTHNDLHGSNVLMRTIKYVGSKPINGNFYLKMFDNDGKEVYIYTDRIATIIDYGRCNIKYNDRYYGFSTIGVTPNRTNTLIDCYRLLMTSAKSAMFSKGKIVNDGLMGVISSILSYFNAKDSIEDIIKEQSKHYFILPYDLPNRSIGEFTEHVMKVAMQFAPEYIRRTDNFRKSSRFKGIIIEGQKKSVNYYKMGIDINNKFNNIEEFYHKIYNSIAREDYSSTYAMRKSFNIEMIDDYFDEIEEDIDNIKDAINKLPDISNYINVTPLELITTQIYNKINNFIYYTINVNESYNDITSKMHILQGIISIYGTDVQYDDIKNIVKVVHNIYLRVDKINNDRYNIIEISSNKVSTIRDPMSSNPVKAWIYDWYTKEAPKLK